MVEHAFEAVMVPHFLVIVNGAVGACGPAMEYNEEVEVHRTFLWKPPIPAFGRISRMSWIELPPIRKSLLSGGVELRMSR